jgi:nucleoside-diphosphate-sugar epimerase
MRVLVAGAGGFIGGHLTKRLLQNGMSVIAVDKKPLSEWYQMFSEAQNLCLDLADSSNCEDIAKNWLKCHQYLWFLYELTKSGPDQMRYMIENKLITKLIDFFLENDSPSVTISKGKRR